MNEHYIFGYLRLPKNMRWKMTTAWQKRGLTKEDYIRIGKGKF